MTLACLLAVALQAADKPSDVELARIEARLFYKETGRLSDDLLALPKPFIGWNTIIGEGEAEERADDILVTLRFQSDKFGADPEKYIVAPVEVTVTNGHAKVIARRSWDHVFTSTKGVEVKALWLNDVTCDGDLNIAARYNGQTKKAKLELDCGE